MTERENLANAKLKLEIKSLELDNQKAEKELAEKPERFKTLLAEYGPALLTPITIISVVIGVFIQVEQNFQARNQAEQVRITQTYRELTKMLRSKNSQEQELGYISFGHFGKAALPYLINHITYTNRLQRVVRVISQIRASEDVDVENDIFTPVILSITEIIDKPKINNDDIKGYRNNIDALQYLSAGIESEVIIFLKEQKYLLEEEKVKRKFDGELAPFTLLKHIDSIIRKMEKG